MNKNKVITMAKELTELVHSSDMQLDDKLDAMTIALGILIKDIQPLKDRSQRVLVSQWAIKDIAL